MIVVESPVEFGEELIGVTRELEIAGGTLFEWWSSCVEVVVDNEEFGTIGVLLLRASLFWACRDANSANLASIARIAWALKYFSIKLNHDQWIQLN